ncbi:hypothetical protein EDD18DRAFT_1347902 [Armillaria luteobubalina]|uniref:Major facilitator superfamily (MFS) profile domain-containing protein n=1 Tax=Armillaria luteobubalina TaxID=153913 RepID=A0AA39V1K3_9AGAR|nr:hypothetical protein EDD18DRAFT_1347902 [Armillaria luteobubalina]
MSTATGWDSEKSIPASPISNDEPLAVDKCIRRKVDLNLIPIIALLYLCSFLDRGNIGNARVAGMGNDLKLTGLRYQLAAAVFFIPYSLLEIPWQVAFNSSI